MRAAALFLALSLSGGAALAQTPSGAEAQAAKEAQALKDFPPPGRLVDVGGGRRLHLFCKGAPGRGPTVLVETGAWASSLYYGKLHDALAPVAHTCLYDRAGLGWSDPAPGPRSLKDRADDLHALLEQSGMKGPFILVGHSMGGLITRFYAKAHPEAVAGLVLVESSEEDFNSRPESVKRTERNAQQLGLAAQAIASGVDVPQLRLPLAPASQVVALRASVVRTGQDDLVAMSKLGPELASVGGLGALGDTPLVVVRRGKQDAGLTPEENAGWFEAQERLAKLSSRSVLMIAENSGHNVPYDQPEAVVEAVRRVMALRGSARAAR
jgi:pimeloyl-ACP methyl ester carboxylesterase